MVGVADGRVELGQFGALLGHEVAEPGEPAHNSVESHGAVGHSYAPQRRPEVFTGASQSFSSSSSAFSTVTEQPAMSSEVM